MTNQQITKDTPIVKYLNDGSYYFNYDIVEKDFSYTDEEGKYVEDIRYFCTQTRIKGIPNYTDVVKALVREYVTEGEEFDLVNTFNRFQLGEQVDITKYREYLNKLSEIKTYVKEYFGNHDNI